MGWGIFESAVNSVADAFEAVGKATVNVVESVGDATLDAGKIVVNGVASVGQGIADVATGDAFERDGWATNLAFDIGDTIENTAVSIADGSLFDAIGDGIDDVIDGSAFDKDGWITNVVEDSVPLGGFVTAGFHAAAGHEDYARMAAVKGTVSTIDFAMGSYTAKFNPLRAAAKGALGGVFSAVTEDTLRDAVPESVQNQLNPLTGATLLASGGMGAFGGVLSSRTRTDWNEHRARAGLGPEESKKYKFFGEKKVSEVNQLDYDRALLDDAIDTTNPNGFFVKEVDIPNGGIAYDYPEWRQGWTGKKLFGAPRKTLPKKAVGREVDEWQESHDAESGGIPSYAEATMGLDGAVHPLESAGGLDPALQGGQWELPEDSLWNAFGSQPAELEGLPGDVEVAVDWAGRDVSDLDPHAPPVIDESRWLEPPEPHYWAPAGEGMPDADQMWQDAVDAYQPLFPDMDTTAVAGSDDSPDWGESEAVDWSAAAPDDGAPGLDDGFGSGYSADAAVDGGQGGAFGEDAWPAADPAPGEGDLDLSAAAPDDRSNLEDPFGTFDAPPDTDPIVDGPVATDEP